MNHTTDGLSCEEVKKLWDGPIPDPAIEPHSTSNDEDELRSTTYREAFSSREMELEDLLYNFNNFFTSRYEQEMTQFQANLSGMLFEQQNHVRRIVKAVTDDCNQPQGCNEIQVHVDDVMNEPQGEHISSDSEPMMTNQNITKCSFSAPEDRDDIKKRRLLELTTLACSVSTILAKPQFRK